MPVGFNLYKAIELDPKNGDAYRGRGFCKGSLEDHRGALADFNKAIELDPKNVSAYYLRGLTKYQIADKNGACLDWSKAGKLGYGDAYDTIKKFCN